MDHNDDSNPFQDQSRHEALSSRITLKFKKQSSSAHWSLDVDYGDRPKQTTRQRQLVEPELCACELCGKKLKSKQALGGHKRHCLQALKNPKAENPSLTANTKPYADLSKYLGAGWLKTGKRGRVTTHPDVETAAAYILISMSRSTTAQFNLSRKRSRIEKPSLSPFEVQPTKNAYGEERERN